MDVKPGYKLTGVGVIPENWVVSTIAEIGIVGRGRVISHKEIVKVLTPLYPVYSSQTSNDGVMGYLDSFKFEGEYITWTTDGANAGTVFYRNGRFNCTNVCGTIKVVGHDARFIALVLARVAPRHVSRNLGNPKLMNDVIKRVKIPIAPLPEQTAIATVLSDVDALLTKLDDLIAKKRDLKQAAMQQLLTGQIRLPGFNGNWEVKLLGQCLLERPVYGINAPAVPYSDRLPVYIRITDITEDGRFYPEKMMSVQSANASKYYLNDGDIVFARTGASVGKSYRFDPDDGSLVFAGFLIRVRPDARKLLPAFLAAYVTTAAYWNWVRLISMRSGQPGINGNEYAQFPILTPPISEQTAIASILSDMDSEIAALEARHDKIRLLKQGMMQELLTGRIRLR